jgi:membrane-associated phospholipid phosphatase
MNHENTGGTTGWRLLFRALLASWVALMIVSGFADLEISRAVVNRDSGWGNWGADFGEIPGYIAAALGVCVAIRTARYRGQQGRLRVVSLSAAGGMLLLLYYGAVRLIDFITGETELLAAAAVSAALLGGSFLLRRRWLEPLRPIALALVILAVVNPLLIVQIFKALWGRVRFRNLGPEFFEFTPWFIPQGITGARSFPSGHAAMGWMLLPIAAFFRRCFPNAGAALRVLVWVLVIGFGVFVAASRVVVGAHYLSDVTFSTGVAGLTVYIIGRVWHKEDEAERDHDDRRTVFKSTRPQS